MSNNVIYHIQNIANCVLLEQDASGLARAYFLDLNFADQFSAQCKTASGPYGMFYKVDKFNGELYCYVEFENNKI